MNSPRITKEITIEVDFWLGTDEDDLCHDWSTRDRFEDTGAFKDAAEEAHGELKDLLEENAEGEDDDQED